MKIKKKTNVYLFADCGDYIMLNGKLPETGGTGKDGHVQRANQFRVILPDPTIPQFVGGKEIVHGSRLTAKVKKPGQDINNWDYNAG